MPCRSHAKAVYTALLSERGAGPGRIDELTRSASRSFLVDQIGAVARLPCDFAADLRSLPTWLGKQNADASSRYRRYLDDRHAGAPRRFFSSRSHALHFLRAVAPTKLVDGAWLYGLLPHWQEVRFSALIRIYLDELGQGRSAQNHVALYQSLLAAHGCGGVERLGDEHFTQGAIQLALAHHAGEFLPEVIGFTLGYEQLPLHLPITAYELAELDIDPYYFTLHVTVDNAAGGHATQALDGLIAALPRLGDCRTFLARVASGYRLSAAGMGTEEAIQTFDLERELLEMLAAKGAVGALLHSDHCRVGGKTVSEWLGSPEQLPNFLQALEGMGWIRRGQLPENSRFWRMLSEEGAPMFGVFTPAEQQLIADWIASTPEGSPLASTSAQKTTRPMVQRFRRPAAAKTADSASDRRPLPHGATVADVLAHHLDEVSGNPSDFNAEPRILADTLAGVSDRSAAMSVLIGHLSPGNHATPAGLLATRMVTALLDARG